STIVPVTLRAAFAVGMSQATILVRTDDVRTPLLRVPVVAERVEGPARLVPVLASPSRIHIPGSWRRPFGARIEIRNPNAIAVRVECAASAGLSLDLGRDVMEPDETRT